MHKFKKITGRALLGAMSPAERVRGRYMRSPDGHGSWAGKEVDDIAREVKTAFDNKFGEHGARLDEIEQKMVRGGGFSGGGSAPQSMGVAFVSNDEVKSFLSDPRAGRRVDVEQKAIVTALTTDANGSAGDLIVPYRDALLTPARRALQIRDLIPVVRVNTGVVQYPAQTGSVNNAATVADGNLKPQSDIKFDLVNVPIQTIAHWMLAARQIMEDVPQLQGVIDTELRYGLDFVEDNQLLNGAGAGTDLNGIYTQATGFAAGTLVIAQPTMIDAISAAILQIQLANLPVTGIVMHPSDWTRILGLKDAAGGYIINNPSERLAQVLFGLPVVASLAMTAGSFLVGDFAGSATLYDRWETRVELSTEDSDNFRRNLVTILAEKRIGLAVKRPTGFVKGTFAAAITDLTS